MANNDNEVVKLIIDAEDLATDELLSASKSVRGLGNDVAKTEKELRQLRVQQDNIQSFTEAANKFEKLTTEVAQATVEYNKLSKSVKENKNATDQEKESVVKAAVSLKQLKSTLTTAGTEYRKLQLVVDKYGVTLTNAAKSQERLGDETVILNNRIKDMRNVYDNQVSALKSKVQAEQQSIKSQRDVISAAQEEAIALNKVFDAQRKATAQKQSDIAETKRVADAVTKYERELDKLHKELQEGSTSKSAYIRGEAKLRQELSLTAKQVSTSKAAIEADAQTKEKAGRSTDALTTVTRRLAQAYTVLLAAQKATALVSDSVKGYGEIETAMIKVEKTTNIARVEMDKMAAQLQQMAEDVTPTATTELLKYAEVAGQLGVKGSEDILRMAKAADALNVSTNLAGDEAVTLLTRILTMTREGVPAIDNIASAVVALGNNSAATEDQIVHMTKEIVSGTRQINLGSTAAAAFGATLAELGQPAERSRTAIQRLSESIVAAVSSGGDDLQRLSMLTGQTADEIEKNLGERPEEVLISLLEGLKRAEKGGALFSTVLKQMGIEGTEANSVLSTLATNTDNLRSKTELANKAALDANAHTQEAIKAYASQDAALLKLKNKFEGITKSIGEAYSPATQTVIENFNTLLDTQAESVRELALYIPQLGTGLVELANSFTSITDGLIESDGALSKFATSVNTAFNTVSIVLNNTARGITSIQLSIAEVTGASEADIKRLQDKITELSGSITRDITDIERGLLRMRGESSLAYETLIDTADKYKSELSGLNDAQRIQIEQILATNQYNKELDSTYIKLSAALVSNHREIAVKTALDKESLAVTVDKTKAAAEQAAAEQAAAAAVKRQAAVAGLSAETIKLLGLESQANVQRTETLTSINNEVDSRVKQAESLVQLNQHLTELQQQYALESNTVSDSLAIKNAMVITEKQIADALIASNTGIKSKSESVRELTAAELSLQEKIQDTSNKMREEVKLQAEGIFTDKQRLESKTKLLNLEVKLNELKAESERLSKIESATYSELEQLRSTTLLQLEQLNSEWERGSITKAEYVTRSKELNKTLSELNPILGENTEAVNENTNAVSSNTSASVSNAVAKAVVAEETKKATTATSLYAGVFEHLNKQFDFSADSTDKLTARMNELTGSIRQNQKVVDGFWRVLAEQSNIAFERERQIIDETLALRDWESQVKSGTLSLAMLNRMAQGADYYFTNLSENQLTGLRSSIEAAKREFQGLSDTIDSVSRGIEDRLDAIQGREQDIAKRKFQREIDELNELIRKAGDAGDKSGVAKLQLALARLRQAQALELKQIAPTKQANQTTTAAKVYTVKIQTTGGSSTSVNVGSETEAQSLIKMLESLGTININGAV